MQRWGVWLTFPMDGKYYQVTRDGSTYTVYRGVNMHNNSPYELVPRDSEEHRRAVMECWPMIDHALGEDQ